MAYIDFSFFLAIYGEETSVDQEVFSTLEKLASDIIDSITTYKIPQLGGLQALPEFVQTLVKKAVAAQVNYIGLQGTEMLATGTTNQGFTVGKVSIPGSSDDKADTKNLISPMVHMYLEQTGLLARSVALCFDRYLPYY